MQATNIENVVFDEANQRKYVVLAHRVLSDGEIYQAIRQEILKRAGGPISPGETLTISFNPSARKPALR